MSLFQEIKFTEPPLEPLEANLQAGLPIVHQAQAPHPAGQSRGGLISQVVRGSVAEGVGLRPDDVLLAINGNRVEDVIDVQFYGAEEQLTLEIEREGQPLTITTGRDYFQPLGLEFAHPTFDIDIRRCNNLCEFCFVLQMAPKFRRTLYIKDDDYRYSFLFGHFVTLTNLSDHDWWRIETMRLSPLYVSVHVTDWELRRQFLRNKKAPDIMAQLRWLAGRGIELHTQLVIVPGFNDGPWLERSIRDLAELYPAVQSISVVPVGLTRQHKYQMRPHTPAEAAATLDFVEAQQALYRQRFGRAFVYPTDEWYLVTGRDVPPAGAYDGQQLQENGLGMVRRFLNAWRKEKREIKAWQRANGRPSPHPGRAITLATATLFAPTLQHTAADFASLTETAVTVKAIVNHRLGETITVSGLLMAQDVIEQLAGTGDNSLLVLPNIMFDHPQQISLDDLSPMAVSRALSRPVALADSLGDVWDALTGRSKLLFVSDELGEWQVASGK